MKQVEQIPARALPRMEKKYNEYCENAVAQQGPSCKLMTYAEFCAVLIQEWWRSILLRPVLPRPPPPTTDGGLSPAGAGQQRGGTADTTDTEGSERKRVTDREEAAKIIQRSWRQHIVRELFLNSTVTVDCDIDDIGSALQAATILVAMASGKNIWRPKFWRKSPIGDQQIKRETCWKNYQ